MPVKLKTTAHGPVDHAETDYTGAGPIYLDEGNAGVPLVRRRIQIHIEGIALVTYTVNARPYKGADHTVEVATGVANGETVWIHAGGSANGLLLDGIEIVLSAGVTDAKLHISSIPEGL
jgi:hypothetical protein